MSGLAALVRFDGGPVDLAALDAMISALAHRGSEPATRWHDGAVGLAHCHRRTSPAARHERQPCVDAEADVALVLDGRVDDPAAVVEALGPDRARLRDGSDAELVLRAYLRWGRAAFARLVGDFAVVVRDGRTRELVAARDPLAARPLHYLRDRRPGHDSLRVASEVVGILADRGLRREPNPSMVAQVLAVSVSSTRDTLFAGVQRVPPGHALVVGPDGSPRLEPTWRWDRAAAVPRSGTTAAEDAAHVEELRELLRTTTRAHLAAPDPVGAELSGGIDSSSVVGLASEALREAGRPPLELVSVVQPGHRYDETEFVREVAAFVGRPAHEHAPRPLGFERYADEVERTLLPAAPPNVAMVEATTRTARDLGCGVLLAGHGGDEWFTGSRYALADDLGRLRLRGLRARARDDRTLWAARTPLHQLVRDGLLPLLGRPRPRSPYLAHLRPAARAAGGLDDPGRLRPDLGGPSRATAEIAALLDDGQVIYEREQAERAYAAWGVERRSPLDDRRVVELALRLPDDVRRRGLATKWVLRKAMDGLVPDAVRLRGWKAGFGDVLVDELRAQGGPARLADLALEEAGLVDPRPLRAAWDAAAGTPRGYPEYAIVWATWGVLWTDRWYRTILSPHDQAH